MLTRNTSVAPARHLLGSNDTEEGALSASQLLMVNGRGARAAPEGGP